MNPNVTVTVNALDKSKPAFDSVKSSVNNLGTSTATLKSKVEALEPTIQKMAVVSGLAFAGIVTVVGKAVGAYAEVERAQRQLERAVLDISHGQKSQVTDIQNITSALQEKAGVDADSLKIGVAQLSTFGLQSESIVKLTKSLADLTVNQSGLNAGSESYIQSANNMAKALNGQFGILEKIGIRFTKTQKDMILYGTEAEKVTALQQGLNQNLRETTDTAGGVDGAIAKLHRAMEDIGENVGQVVVPALAELARVVTPVLQKIGQFIQNNPTLTKTLVTVAGAVTALGTTIGVLALGYLAISSATSGANNALAMFGTTSRLTMAVLSPYLVILGSVAIAMALIKDKMDAVSNTHLSFQTSISTATASFNSARAGISTYDGQLQSLNQTLVSAQNELISLGKQAGDSSRAIADAVKESEERQKGFKENKAEAFVEQENKITRLEKEQIATRKSLREVDHSDESDSKRKASQEKLQLITSELEKERTALANASALKQQLSAQIAEVERFNALTEFEQKIERIDAESALEAQRLAKRMASLSAEASAVGAQQKEIQARITETQKAIVETEKKASQQRISTVFNEARAVINAEQAKASIRGQSTKKYDDALKALSKREVEARNSINNPTAGQLDDLRSGATSIVGSVGTTVPLSTTEQYGGAVGSVKSIYDTLKNLVKPFNANAYSGGGAVPFANGGIVTKPTFGLVGEAGAEAVIPLSQLSTMGGITINIGSMIGERKYAEQMGDQIIRVLKMNGRI